MASMRSYDMYLNNAEKTIIASVKLQALKILHEELGNPAFPATV